MKSLGFPDGRSMSPAYDCLYYRSPWLTPRMLLMVFATDCCSLKHQRRIEFMNGRLTTIKLSGSVTKFSYKWGFEKFALADGRGRDIEGEL